MLLMDGTKLSLENDQEHITCIMDWKYVKLPLDSFLGWGKSTRLMAFGNTTWRNV